MNLEKTKKSLEKNGFEVSCFETKEDAKAYMINNIKNKSVGIGGSMTIQELEIFDKLKENNEVFWHWKKREDENVDDIFKKAMLSEIYITSANGLAETGEIINIDGAGNRVSASLFGHKKVYFVIGKNKIARNYDEALYRARNIAAPLNAKRLSRKTPCVKSEDKCFDCNAIEKICSALVVLWQKPYACDYEVVLINENLGY